MQFIKDLKLTKADLVLAVIFLLAAGAIALWFAGYFTEGGAYVRIVQDGEEIGVYPLAQDNEIVLGDRDNVVIIEEGSVYMESASCDNQHCVFHAPIKRGNEQIICLPNKVLVEILDGGESEIDIVAN